VIGCPKTIDVDLKCKEVPTSFGFDTACKVSINILSYLNQNAKISDFPYVMHYEFSCWNYLIVVFH
jgi:6-phosphofructokinase